MKQLRKFLSVTILMFAFSTNITFADVSTKDNNSTENFNKWGMVVDVPGIGLPKDGGITLQGSLGAKYLINKDAYVSARIGYNSYQYNKNHTDLSEHFLMIPIETGYAIATSNKKFDDLKYIIYGNKTVLNSHSSNI